MTPRPHPQEEMRLAALQAYDILDTLPEQDFDDITRIAAAICDTPIAAISLVDNQRQWFKSALGLNGIAEMPRPHSLCAHTIMDAPQITIVLDPTKDERFRDNPLVQGEDGLRFYAGAPIQAPDEDLPLGTLCVADTKLRLRFTAQQEATLAALSRQVSNLLALRRRERELKEANEKLAQMAATDRLTGLANRRALDARLVEEVARAERHSLALSALVIDVDFFKRLNDAHGHAAGDAVLQGVAAALLEGCRHGSGDFIARSGGEEFIALLPETTLREALILAERLRAAVAERAYSFGPVTISVGASQLTPGEHNGPNAGAHLLAAADQALYQAKTTGRNRVAAV